MQAVLLTFIFFQHADKNKLQQGSFTQIFNGRLKSDSFLPCRSLPGADRASYGAVRTAAWGSSALARDEGTHQGSGRERARWLQVGPGCGPGRGLRPAAGGCRCPHLCLLLIYTKLKQKKPSSLAL